MCPPLAWCSRQPYHLSLCCGGQPTAVKAFQNGLLKRLKSLTCAPCGSIAGKRPPEMRQTLGRRQKFLSLVALLAALLSAVAVALAARGFAADHLDASAMLRVLGRSQAPLRAPTPAETALIGVASALGVAVGCLGAPTCLCCCCRPGRSALPAPSLLARGLWFGYGAHAAVGLWFAARAATGAGAAAARHPPRCGRARACIAGRAVRGCGGFAALLLAVSSDLELGLITPWRLCRGRGPVAGLSWVAVKLLRKSVRMKPPAPRWLVLATRRMLSRPACRGAGQQPGRRPCWRWCCWCCSH